MKNWIFFQISIIFITSCAIFECFRLDEHLQTYSTSYLWLEEPEVKYLKLHKSKKFYFWHFIATSLNVWMFRRVFYLCKDFSLYKCSKNRKNWIFFYAIILAFLWVESSKTNFWLLSVLFPKNIVFFSRRFSSEKCPTLTVASFVRPTTLIGPLFLQ